MLRSFCAPRARRKIIRRWDRGSNRDPEFFWIFEIPGKSWTKICAFGPLAGTCALLSERCRKVRCRRRRLFLQPQRAKEAENQPFRRNRWPNRCFGRVHSVLCTSQCCSQTMREFGSSPSPNASCTVRLAHHLVTILGK